MNSKIKNTKTLLHKIHGSMSIKEKKRRNSTTKTPKNIINHTMCFISPNLRKAKSIPNINYCQDACVVMHNSQKFYESVPTIKNKVVQSNLSVVENQVVHSYSEKTIMPNKNSISKRSQNSKSIKTKKNDKYKKGNKLSENKCHTDHEFQCKLNQSVKSKQSVGQMMVNLNAIHKKTENILNEYKRKQACWQKERQKLMSQLRYYKTKNKQNHITSTSTTSRKYLI